MKRAAGHGAMKRYVLTAALLLTACAAWGQKYPERRHIRAGNREYAGEKWVAGEAAYRRALEKTPDSYEARFNLGNALYRQQKWEEASKTFAELAADSTRTDRIGAAHYNGGNAMFGQKKLKEALEAYKNSMRADPTDMDAKYNYAYVKKMLDDQQQQGGGGGGQNDQQQDQNKQDGQDKQQGQDGQDGQDKQQGQDGQDKKDGQDNGQGDKGQQQVVVGMSREDADQMLDAIQVQEDHTQDKVDEEKKNAATARSRRNW